MSESAGAWILNPLGLLRGGQSLLARDEHNPDAPLVRRRIVRTYERTAYHLQVLTLADADGRRQTLRVTDEHPFYRPAPAAGGSADAPGWTPARSLAAGDEVLGDCGVLTVVANAGEAHRQGVKVYNLEVEQAHTYFVLAEHAPDGANAVWVHNAKYTKSWFEQNLEPGAKAEWFEDLASIRRAEGLGAASDATGVPTRSLLERVGGGDGDALYGGNGWAKAGGFADVDAVYAKAQGITGLNLRSVTHAEGDVLYQAALESSLWKGQHAIMTVDRTLCEACIRGNDGVFSAAKNLGLRSLELRMPGGRVKVEF